MRGRTKTFKYKNYQYSDEVKKLLAISLSDYDKRNINEIRNNLKLSNMKRGYEYIIEDLYILVIKHNFTSSQLAKIYSLNVRSIQIWLKELGLNRTLKDAKKASLEMDLLISIAPVTMPFIFTGWATTATSSCFKFMKYEEAGVPLKAEISALLIVEPLLYFSGEMISLFLL